MASVIKSIDRDSPADRTKLSPGDTLISINGREISDVLDYKFYSYDERLTIVARSPEGKVKKVKLKKPEGMDIGIEFETYLMDKTRSCANRCLFCFVDQLPKNMRHTLYFKDDDARMSFLLGNYITLTNMSRRDADRIVEMHVSPINVSVHTMNPELRSFMLGNKNGGRSLDTMRRFAEAGIKMNCQIVCCPGINDGSELQYSMEELSKLYPSVNSVSIVPVGLTKHREGLYKLEPFNKKSAEAVLDQVESFGEKCLEKFGTRIFFCADELYLKARRDIPEDGYYEDYPQLENGVGMLRLLFTEFESAMKLTEAEEEPEPFTIVTGVSAAPFMEKLLCRGREKFPELSGNVIAVKNEFFGTTIDVAGLVTGRDIENALKSCRHERRVLIPKNMLRHGEGIFLDDITTEDIEREFDIKIIQVEQDGFELLEAMLGIKD